MLAFSCQNCGQLVFFENSECLRCHTPLGYAPDRGDLLSLQASTDGSGTWVALDGRETDRRYVRCANARLAECNWLVLLDPADGAPSGGTAPNLLCRCCELTRTRPSDDDVDGMEAFADTEAAKRRLVFQLLDLDLPVVPYDDDVEQGLAFDLLSSRTGHVLTGHDDGLITLDLAESDDARREQVRHELGEPYRTVLGHLRHEIGHYYWPLLVERHDPALERFRGLFGDERCDYQSALGAHYASGPPPDWPERHVSSYATMHPWEDWAETFSHYLHIRDTLETAASFGLHVEGPEAPGSPTGALSSTPDLGLDDEPFAAILADWLPLTYALNAVNRSMGKGDLYPFVLPPTVIDKLAFVHARVTLAR